jgi:phosphatidylserine/phosphatidylglycerophosphate/cardiolipin synthase-like enzyme
MKLRILLTALLAIIFSCRTGHIRYPNQDTTPQIVKKTDAQVTKPDLKDWLTELPGNATEYVDQVRKILVRNNKNKKLPYTTIKKIGQRISKYVAYIMYKYPDPLIKKQIATSLINRLMQSSVQFILCTDLNDFKCLEQTPLLQPTVKFRIENPELKLGEIVNIEDSLEKNMEYYFNDQIFAIEDNYDSSKGVAKILENKIKSVGTDSKNDGLYMAIYGMDDIDTLDKNTGSLSGIYNALSDRMNVGTNVYAVFDQGGANPTAERPLVFSYIPPPSPAEQKKWILGPLETKTDTDSNLTTELTNLSFQYNGGTQGLLRKLNQNIKSNEEARGRLEWPSSDLMHNKFFIFKNNSKLSVWTGTANISRTDIGTERNSNLSVYINNTEVAESYLTEFLEMYEFRDPETVSLTKTPNFVGLNNTNYFPIGRFHRAKSPNTKRYFNFQKDQTELRLYFSPTDDAEHRAILPMLLSAQSGDQILISMYGAAGIEYVRALQLASARGVDIQIIVDSPTACGSGSWAGRTGDATLIENNPFRGLNQNSEINLKPIQIHKNNKNIGLTWKQNHQKIGLLIRKKSDGTMSPENFIFGSQNWSISGNDQNDENLIALRKQNGPIKIAQSFEDHFKNFLWPKSESIPDTGCTEIPTEIPVDGK